MLLLINDVLIQLVSDWFSIVVLALSNAELFSLAGIIGQIWKILVSFWLNSIIPDLPILIYSSFILYILFAELRMPSFKTVVPANSSDIVFFNSLNSSYIKLVCWIASVLFVNSNNIALYLDYNKYLLRIYKALFVFHLS